MFDLDLLSFSSGSLSDVDEFANEKMGLCQASCSFWISGWFDPTFLSFWFESLLSWISAFFCDFGSCFFDLFSDNWSFYIRQNILPHFICWEFISPGIPFSSFLKIVGLASSSSLGLSLRFRSSEISELVRNYVKLIVIAVQLRWIFQSHPVM